MNSPEFPHRRRPMARPWFLWRVRDGAASSRRRFEPRHCGRRVVRIGTAVLGILGAASAWGSGHQHLNAGALGSGAGTPLSFINGDRFAAESGYVVALEKAAGGSQAGLHRGTITLTSLPATLDYGGPAFGHAAFGAHLAVIVESVTGPSGGRFGFWEGADGEEGTILTFEVPVGEAEGTRQFALSETPGAPEDDPYGHIHGRVFTATAPGLYTVGLRLVDVSGNGLGGGPLHPPSALFRIQFQAGVTIAHLGQEGGQVRVTFGALTGYTYWLEQSEALGPDAIWMEAGGAVRGTDHLVEVVVPTAGGTRFFRLRRNPN
ncbi:MAG: hypothetical protein JNK85_28555 [Verrucomicrobiales bacterium]|nr:hypothetical protein [Verrucomicrobiales bacterium]